MSLEHTQKAESLFDEINKMIKTYGLEKALIHLRSINMGSVDIQALDDIKIYEFIINTIIAAFNVSENQLYNDRGKFVATDARQSAYVLISKHLKYSQESIATQFSKSRSSVAMAMVKYEEMISDDFYKDYQQKHTMADKEVDAYVNRIRSNKRVKKED